jgi:hypothetical protein
MHCKVKILRRAGQRRHDHDISADPGIDGDLTLARVGATLQLKLAARDDSQQKPLIPILYDTHLVTMHGNKMLFYGVERSDGSEVEQEWTAMVLST